MSLLRLLPALLAATSLSLSACGGNSSIESTGPSTEESGSESNTQDSSEDESVGEESGETGTGDGDGDGDGDNPGCDSEPPFSPPYPEGLGVQAQWANQDEYELYTEGIWAIWWHPDFNHADDAVWLAAELDDVRCRSIAELGMQDPPNLAAGLRYNVYIHHGAADPFPEGWANGQGTNASGLPFLTLPEGAHLDPGNIAHEGFHVFQYSANSPGFAYAGDSQWYVESAAQWYAAYRRPDDVNTFIEAGAIDGNPHLALWHSFSNEAPGDATDWLFQVRQYGMHTWLFYITEVAEFDRDVITAGFFGGETVSPQEYHPQEVGADAFRSAFADWAAHNTADFDYLTPEQVQRARDEVLAVADLDNLHPYVGEYIDAGTNGMDVAPPGELTPRGWSYNVVKIDNSQAAAYDFTLTGDAMGSEGASSQLQGRVVVLDDAGASYTDLDMSDTTIGSASVSVEASDSEVYLVIAAVPEHFGGNQTYGYTYRIDRQ